MYHIRRAPSRSFWHKPVGSDELAQAFERHLAQQEQFEPGEAVFDHFLGSAERLRDSQASADVVVVTGPERDTFRALQQTAHRQAKAQAGGDKLADELLYGDQIRASAWLDPTTIFETHGVGRGGGHRGQPPRSIPEDPAEFDPGQKKRGWDVVR